MRHAEPTCSVVIPTFNAAHVIGQQLRALTQQVGAPAFEVLVVDNNSTDDLAAIVRSWSEALPALQIIDASRGRGVSVARNVGIAAAATDQILICDADDQVSNGWVAALSRGLEEHPLVSGPLETSLLSGRSVSWVPIPALTTELFETWGARRYGVGCNLGLRRGVWREIGGFDETYPAGAEEIDFAWRAADAGYLTSYVPDALVHYRIRTDLRGVLRQQFNSGRGTATLYAKFRPTEVVPKSLPRRLHHEWLLLKQFPWRGNSDQRRMWCTVMAFELGKLREAHRLGVPAP